MNFRVISSFYDTYSSLPKEERVYSEMLASEDFNSIASLLYQFLNAQGKLDDTPLFFQKKLKERFNETFYLNLFIKNQTMQILKVFEELGIHVIPLKGVLFSEKYFGHLGARGTTDIDLLIHYNDFGKARETIRSLGFTVEEEMIQYHFHSSFSKQITGSPVPLVVELHWNLLKEYTSNVQIKEIWDKATPYKSFKFIKELSNFHTFYFMCLHSWRHNLSSTKHYLDIIHLIEVLKMEIDYTQLIKEAVSHKTSKRIIRTLSIVYKEFPHLHMVKELKVNSKLVFRKNELIGIRKYFDIIDYQFFNYDSLKHGLKQFRVWIKEEGSVALIKKIKNLMS